MLARHAESMFWAGRYVERAEDTARMLGATLQSAVSAGPTQASVHLGTLLRTLRLEVPSGTLRSEEILQLLVNEPTAPGSIVSSIGHTRENLRTLREQVPSELWEQTNRLHLRLQGSEFNDDLMYDPFNTLDHIRESCQTLSGVIATAMSRDEGYRFLILGQMIERALMTGRLVSVRLPEMATSAYEEMALTLRSASALEAYQRAFHASADPADVVRFLLFSERFPRSLLFCLRRAEAQLMSLSDGVRNRALRLMGQLRSGLEFADLEEVLQDVIGTLDELDGQIRHVADVIATQYFRAAEELDLHSQLLVPGVLT